MIKVILLGGLIGIGFAMLRMRNTHRTGTSASKRIVLVLFLVAFVVSVLFPDLTTKVAVAVGVGRGADLVLYLLALAFVFLTLYTYLRFRDARYQLGELARWIAVHEAGRVEPSRPRPLGAPADEPPAR